MEAKIIASVISSASYLIYKILMEWHYGWTLGKKLCKVRVADLNGGRLSFSQAVSRQLPLMVFSVFGSLNTIHTLPALEKAITSAEKHAVLENSPYYSGLLAAGFIWWLSCFLIVTRRDKRAGHDLLAGTKCVGIPNE